MIVALKAKILLIIIFVLLACQNIGNNNEFDGVWAALTSREQARVLNLLVERVEHDGQAGNVSITFRPTGIKVNSGLCLVRGRQIFVMNKHNPIRKKVAVLAECLREFEHDQEYVVPAIRDLLAKEQK